MQDLASAFSKIFRGWYRRTLTEGGGDPLQHAPSPACGGRGALVPSTFQPWLCPWLWGSVHISHPVGSSSQFYASAGHEFGFMVSVFSSHLL